MKRDVVARIVPLAVIFLVLVFLMPKNSKFPYDYRKGREWKYETLFAQFDFPIYKTDEQIREERNSSSGSVIPYYRYSEETSAKAISSIERLPLGRLRNVVMSEVRSIYDKGVMEDSERRHDMAAESEVIYVQKDKRAVKYPASEVYTLSGARNKLLSDLSGMTDVNVDSLLRRNGVYELIVPNLIYDQQTTELVHEESGGGFSPTSGYVTAGQLIVSEGEIVTAEIEQMLDSYKREFEANVGYLGPPVLIILGNIVIAAALVVLLYFVVRFACRELFSDSRYPYLLLVYLLFAVLTLLLLRANERLVYAVPYTLSALMLQTFLPPRKVVPLYVAILSPLLLFSHDGAALFMMFLLAGLVVLHLFRYFQQGWRQFIAASITFGVLALLYLGFRGADLVAGNVWSALLSLFVASMLTVAGYPLTYLFEKLFNLVSDSRLVELSDTSNPVIRELEQKAPGTFQHSLQVMNMADFVARAVGENPELVRVGALYHDIGKMNNPLCFVENEFIVPKDDEEHKYHTGLSPVQSAHDIIRHVSDGVDIAKKNRLPRVVVDFIVTHHGTTVVSFFYDKFLKEGGDPSRKSEFTYPGVKPKTRAQIILMLCDSIEAASRTLKTNTPQGYSDFVERIVAGKMAEGQFDDADITISELNTVKETLKQYLAQLNHERVVYPKTKTNKK